MDPLTALGLASNIIQFLTFTGTLISESREAYDSVSGTSKRNSELESVASNLITLHQQLAGQIAVRSKTGKSGSNLSVAETQLQNLTGESIAIAEKLIETVRGLKGKGGNKRWKSVRYAIVSAWCQKDVEALKMRLGEIRMQLDTALLICLREQMNSEDNSKVMHQRGCKQSEMSSLFLKEIKAQHKDILQAIRRYEIRPSESQIKEFSISLEATAELGVEGQFGKLILSHLEYAEIQDRYEQICQAHRSTFEWIFKEPDEPLTRWDDFSQWLLDDGVAGEQNFYFITGKAGSGKSTLIKYIFDDDRTLHNLQTWASGNQLLTAGFFFWNSGTEVQMSGVGLLRTLLYQVLRQNPSLIRQVLCKRWETYQSARGGFHEWTWLELKQAFEHLTQIDGIRIALFIDGLDEFDGDHEELTSFLLRITGPTLKICAASRPWLVFEDAFSTKPNLLLENLTLTDIRLYVHDAFTSNPHFSKLQLRNQPQATDLISSVVNKASGVFLWVYLVVKSLLQGMANADRISDLKRRLDSLPADLEDLFDKLLRSLEPFYFSHAAQLIRILESAPVPPTPLEMAYADEEDVSAALTAPIRVLTPDEAAELTDSIRRRLNSRCKGLLSVSQYGTSHLERVEFLHRTVKDFVHKPHIWASIMDATPEDFDPVLCWANSILMELKTSDPETVLPADLFRLVQWGVQHAEQSEAATRECQVRYLDEVDRTVKGLVAGNTELERWMMPEYFSSGTCFLDLVFQHGMVFYVLAKLKDRGFEVGKRELDILLDTVVNSEVPDSGVLVKIILERGGDFDRASLEDLESFSAVTTLRENTDTDGQFKEIQIVQSHSTGSSGKTSWRRDRPFTRQVATKIEGFWSL